MVTGHQGQTEGVQDQVRIIDQTRSQGLKQTRGRNQGGELGQDQGRAVGGVKKQETCVQGMRC